VTKEPKLPLNGNLRARPKAVVGNSIGDRRML
jgi:hypothetical protein